MKKLFTIIAVASMMLTTVFGFTSCQKDELPAPAPQQTYVSNNGNNGQSVTVTAVNSQYDNNSGKSTTTYINELSDPFKGIGGTWEYIDADGTKCSLELSNETTSACPSHVEVGNGKSFCMEAKYDAKLTIGDQTYAGSFMNGIFVSGECKTSINTRNYLSSVSANSFNADIKAGDNVTAQGITLTKIK